MNTNSRGKNTGTWTAEDVPMYMVDKSQRRPMTDEDAAMSAPNRLGKDLPYREALALVAAHLLKSATYNFIERDGSAEFYRSAAAMFGSAAGTDEGYHPLEFGLQIHGRFYRVRRTDV